MPDAALPSRERLTIHFAHPAYRLAERFALRDTGIAHFQTWNAEGDECSRALFVNDDGVLRSRSARIPIMMTTNRVIAETDCLFYSVSLA